MSGTPSIGPRSAWRFGLLLSALLATSSCKGDDGDSAAPAGASGDDCSDVDGPGGDTGNVPAVLGSWNVSFGEERYNAVECDYEGLSADDLEFLDGAMVIDGRVPDTLYAEFRVDDTRYWGLQDSLGGIVFTGQRDYREYTLHVTFGGHVFEHPVVENQYEIRGFAYIGVDGDRNNTIDCWTQATFRAIKAGN